MLQINMNDVITAIQSAKPQIIFFCVILVLAILAFIAAAAVKRWSRATQFIIRTEAGISIFLALVIAVNMICFGPMATMISLSTGAGTISDESMDQAYDAVDQIGNEGTVLLKNEGGLPVDGGTKMNVFGWSSTNPIYGGVGSGAISKNYEIITPLKSLEDAGIQINADLTDFYTKYQGERPEIGMWNQDWTLPEPAVSEYPEELLTDAEKFSDKAVIFISRPGGENADLPTDMAAVVDGSWSESDKSYVRGVYDDTLNEGNDWEDGQHYLELNNREKEMLEMVCSRFNEVTVVVNTNNAMELGWLNEYEQIKSAIWLPCPGQSGFSALGKVMTGEVNPSGRTVDSFIRDLTTTPVANNFGDFVYDNMEEHAYNYTDWTTKADMTAIPTFVNYVEGIYVGYKYYETAYEEAQSGRLDFDYDSQVVYPFGYGLSYTTFEQAMTQPKADSEGNLTFDVTVTNTGVTAGKDVVEVYYNPPYTDGGIEKASANLLDFEKTKLLEPGESQKITFNMNNEEMASYDYVKEKAYVLEKGEYKISIRRDSHTIIDEQSYTVADTVIFDENNARSSDAVSAENQFNDAFGDKVTYLSRAGGFANYDQATAAPSDLSMSDEYKATFINNQNYNPEDYNRSEDEMPVTAAKNGLKLEDLRGAEYDDPKWDDLLDQLSVEDMDKMIAYGGYSTTDISSVGLVGTTDCDGPASINNNFTNVSSIGFPGCTLIAATWNIEMPYAYGDRIGLMADEMDVSGWYAPAMNIHRSAFSGRNFEYFSEDGVLSGKMAAQAVLGAEEHGVYSFIKHFAFNDQEMNRNDMICTWSNEQAIREIYLKPFEICVKEGKTKAVMSTFSYIGTIWGGAYYPLQTTVLRDEWGFRGMVLTDYYGVYGYMDADQAIRGGTDICLSPMDNETNHLTDTKSATSIKAARQSCKNIMYTIVNSRAYDPENLNVGMSAWQKAAIGIDILLAMCIAILEFIIIRKYLRMRDGSIVIVEE